MINTEMAQSGTKYLTSVVQSLIGEGQDQVEFRVGNTNTNALFALRTSESSPQRKIMEVTIYDISQHQFPQREQYPAQTMIIYSTPERITLKQFQSVRLRDNKGVLFSQIENEFPLSAPRLSEFIKTATKIEETFDDKPALSSVYLLDKYGRTPEERRLEDDIVEEFDEVTTRLVEQSLESGHSYHIANTVDGAHIINAKYLAKDQNLVSILQKRKSGSHDNARVMVHTADNRLPNIWHIREVDGRLGVRSFHGEWDVPAQGIQGEEIINYLTNF